MKCSIWFRVSLSIAIAVATSCGRAQTPATADGTLKLYVSPSGDDSRSGESVSEAVASLERVQQLLKDRQFKEGQHSVNVRFLPGTYKKQGVTWNVILPDNRPLVFEPDAWSPGKFPVVIDGTNADTKEFFLLRITKPGSDDAPVSTNITVRGFHITNYCEGVSLGDWKSASNVADNVIEENKFSRIGSKYQTPRVQSDGRRVPDGNCVAAIRLQRASRNVVRHNRFENIENLPAKETAVAKYGPLLLHSIYLSNNSMNNRIEGNDFSKFTGSPVRIRAQSDGTKVVDNTFSEPLVVKAPAGFRIKAVSQWYCNDGVEICKDRAEEGQSECPSVNTEISGNKVKGNLELYADESQSKNSTCATSSRASKASIEPRLDRNTLSR